MKLTMVVPQSVNNWVTFVMPNTFSIISINYTGLHRWEVSLDDTLDRDDVGRFKVVGVDEF